MEERKIEKIEMESFTLAGAGTDVRVIIGKVLAEPKFREAFRENPEAAIRAARFEISRTDLKLLHRGLTTDGAVILGVQGKDGKLLKTSICNNCNCSAEVQQTR